MDPVGHADGGDLALDGGGRYPRPGRVFVGRQRELDALAAALAAARAGQPQVVLIQGDGGIGKSSLVYEFFGSQPALPVIMASGEAAGRYCLTGWCSSWRPRQHRRRLARWRA